jgi:hypothetical protein
MANNRQGGINDASSGGVTGTHPDADPFQIVAGPSTEDQKNAVQLPLVAISCWGVDDVRFAFDSSFLDVDYDGNENPPEDIRQELIALKALLETNKGCPIALFGHADPVGSDVYNKGLSERRARSVYALLIYKSEPSLAVQYWNQISAEENWGDNQQNTMQSFVSQGGGQTGSSLIDSYLKKLSEPGPQLSKTDFLAQGAGSDRKGDFQGCSEFNPLLIFSQTKQDQFDQAKANNDQAGIAERDAQNARNRRVLGLIFRKGSSINSTKWPCPRASAGISGCQQQFWSDGETRRSTHLPDTDRRLEDKQDTFACRFYERIAGISPCEKHRISVRVRLYDLLGQFIARAPFQYQLGPGAPVRKVANDHGIFLLRDVSLPSRLQVAWGFEPTEGNDPEYVFASDMFLPLDAGSAPQSDDSSTVPKIYREKLHNLGYPYDDDAFINVTYFQRDFGHLASPQLKADGGFTDQTASLIRNVFRGCENQLREDKPQGSS